MSILVHISLIIIASIVLAIATDKFIKATIAIARVLNISGYTISFLLISTVTSLPEAMVGITSALGGNPQLSFGNAIGSNIALLTLVIALPILLNKPIHTGHNIKHKDIYYALTLAVIVPLLAMTAGITKPMGYVLLGTYLIYTLQTVKEQKHLIRVEQWIEKHRHKHLIKHAIIFIISLAILLMASEWIVKETIILTNILKWNIEFIGVTITALGTSLPEIAFTIGAMKKHKETSIIGDISGSVIANTTGVLGITAIISAIPKMGNGTNLGMLLFSIIATTLFGIFYKTKRNISKMEALALLLIYFLFIYTEFALQIISK